MPWVRIDDRLPMSAKIQGLADPDASGDKAKRQRNEALGHWLLVLTWCGSERSDGFVTARQIAEYGTADTTARLLRSRFGRAPLIHRRGDACPCLEGRKWPPDYDHAVHDWLDKNPSREENDVAKAIRKELRDRELREAVRRRDGDCCRYCGKQVKWQDRRSGDGGVLDHVVPDLAAGADNLVVACRACNTRKGKRTPEAAGMTLLPPPGHPKHPTRPATNDRPINDGSETVPDPTTDRTQNGPETDHRSDSETEPDPPPDPTTTKPPATSSDVPAALADAFPEATCVDTTGTTSSEVTDGPGRGGTGNRSGSGRAGYAGPRGERPTVGPPTTARTSVSPNPYLRSAITGPAPEDHAGPAPWPPGSQIKGAWLPDRPPNRPEEDWS